METAEERDLRAFNTLRDRGFMTCRMQTMTGYCWRVLESPFGREQWGFSLTDTILALEARLAEPPSPKGPQQ